MHCKYFLILAAAGLLLTGCSQNDARALTTGGDADRGAAAITHYGCGACHTVPGVRGAHGLVGPPLSGFGNRMYVAGMLPNEAGNLMRWVENPQSVNAKTAMPNLGVTERDAADIGAYLYSLK